MKPSLGRIVLVNGPRVNFNGTNTVPAVITRVWGKDDTINAPQGINVHCFLDGPDLSVHLSSIMLCETREEAEKLQKTHPHVAWWPERV